MLPTKGLSHDIKTFFCTLCSVFSCDLSEKGYNGKELFIKSEVKQKSFWPRIMNILQRLKIQFDNILVS